MTFRLHPAGLAILLAGALALPVTASESPVLNSDISTSGVHIDGSYRLEGPVQAFLQENLTTPCTANPVFVLQADHLVLENDTTDVALHPTDNFHSPFTYDAKTTHEEHAFSSVKGVVNRAGCRWNLFPRPGYPLPGIELSGTCANSNPSDTMQVVRYPVIVSKRNHTSVDAATGSRWNDCSTIAIVNITGDFQLSLWNWDAILSDHGASETILTGPRQSPLIPSQAPEVSPTVSRDQETYLFVHNGTLTTTLGSTPGLLYVGQTTVSAPSLQLEGAAGRLRVGSTTQELHASAVALEGSVQVALRGTGVASPLEARLTGTPTRLVVDGVTIPIAPVSGKSAWGKWGWMVGALGLVAVPVVVVPVRRSKAARRRRLVALTLEGMQWLTRGQTEAASRVALKMLDLDPGYPSAHYIQAIYLGELEDHKEALDLHKAASNMLKGSRHPDSELTAANALQAASTAALWRQPNREEEVLAWLKECLQADPAIEEQLPDYPELRPFLAALGFQLDDPAFG